MVGNAGSLSAFGSWTDCTRDIEAHVIHGSSVAVSREHWRAKTDWLDAELLERSFLGWLRGEREQCEMVEIRQSRT